MNIFYIYIYIYIILYLQSKPWFVDWFTVKDIDQQCEVNAETDEKTGSGMRNIWVTGNKSWEEGTLTETYSMEENEGSSDGGRKRSAGRKGEMNDCGLGGKNGNLLNVSNPKIEGGNHKVWSCITSMLKELGCSWCEHGIQQRTDNG